MQMIVIAVLGAILIFVISPTSAEGKSLLSVKLIILLLLFVLRTTVVE